MKRLTHKFVKSYFLDRGYDLLENYTTSEKRMKAMCPQRHVVKISWKKFRINHRCRLCRNKERSVPESAVKTELASKGYLLVGPYKNGSTVFTFVCPKGHTDTGTYGSFLAGHMCGFCTKKKQNKESIKKYMSECGYVLLSGDYKNGKSRFTVKCGNNHAYKTTWNTFRDGKRCPHCAGSIVTQEQVELAFNKRGYVLLSQYTGHANLLEYRCPQGHRHRMSWDAMKIGNGCPFCADYGFNPSQPASLYYLAFYHPEHLDSSGTIAPLYKIGITNRTIEERFAPEPTLYRIISETRYLFGHLAHEEEQRTLKEHAAHRYSGPKLLVSGNTELFTRDVLKLDTQHNAAQSRIQHDRISHISPSALSDCQDDCCKPGAQPASLSDNLLSAIAS